MITPTPAQDARILIVDDQDANLRLLERILQHGGYTCYRSVSDPREAVLTHVELKSDLILLDLMMPHLDGIQVMERLRPVIGGDLVPIVVLTCDVTAEARRRALAAGAKDFLTKPVDAVEVLLRIKNLLETRFLYQQLRQQSDQRIREQAALLDQANDAILVGDMEDRIQYWNRGAERLYGWTAAEAVGRKAGEFLYRPSARDLQEANETVVREGKWERELRHVTKDQGERIVSSRWTLVRDGAGSPQCKLIINTDVTEQKKLETHLAQVQRLEAVGRLAGGVAHDFNNLLSIISGCSELALHGLSREQPVHRLIHDVHDAAERAKTLTQQLLAFGRQQNLAPVVLNLNGLVGNVESILRRLISKEVELTTLLEPELGVVKADPGQMEQVLMNLVVNARDAMPSGGKLTIETRNVERPAFQGQAEPLSGPCVMLAVRDTGSGIDETVRARIFEPFFTTKEPGKGTGLGLATVYGIVKQSGGSITVQSEPGQGTSFEVYLPRLVPETVLTGPPAIRSG